MCSCPPNWAGDNPASLQLSQQGEPSELSWGPLCLHRAGRSGSRPSGCKGHTLPEPAPSHLSGMPLSEADSPMDRPYPGTSASMSSMELAGQMNFHEDRADKQWDPRLLRFGSSGNKATPGMPWVGPGAALAMRALEGGGVMVGPPCPSLSLAPLLTPSRPSSSGEEPLLCNFPRTPARGARSPAWEQGRW